MELHAQGYLSNHGEMQDKEKPHLNPFHRGGAIINRTGTFDPTVLTNPPKTHKPTVTAFVNNIKAHTLIDTGATCSVISTHLASVLTGVKWLPSEVRPYAASGRKLKCICASNLMIQLGDITIQHTFQVIEGLQQDCLIGTDLLQRIGTSVTFDWQNKD